MISAAKASVVSRRRQKLTEHWPEYASEGSGLGLFMISACTFATLLAHPDSPIVRLVQNATLLRFLMGVAMGSTAVALIYSKLGRRSGAHMNPATTFTFLRLRKIEPVDALFYVAAQFVGAIAGVYVASIALGRWLSHPAVDYVVTLPGPYGQRWAFAAEFAILECSRLRKCTSGPTAPGVSYAPSFTTTIKNAAFFAAITHHQWARANKSKVRPPVTNSVSFRLFVRRY